jgi:hypothetical protein
MSIQSRIFQFYTYEQRYFKRFSENFGLLGGTEKEQ